MTDVVTRRHSKRSSGFEFEVERSLVQGSRSEGRGVLAAHMASNLTEVDFLWLPCRYQRSFGAGRRVITCPAVKRGVNKTSIGQHFQERPPPNRAGNSVGPSAFVGDFFWRDVGVQQDVRHLESSARPQNAMDFSQHH